MATEADLSAGADIVWLRDDFRLDDQPAIDAAASRPALYVYVHDDSARNGRPLGGAAKWRLAQSLKAFAERLAARGARLDIVSGEADRIILALARAAEARRVSERARSNKATREELVGSTITVTSLGKLGGIASTPVINAPEVAIIIIAHNYAQIFDVCDRINLIEGGVIAFDKPTSETSVQELTERN